MTRGAGPMYLEEYVPVFGCEVNVATETFSQFDNPNAPSKVLLPTGVTTRSVYVVGVLAEIMVNDAPVDQLHGRLVDTTGNVFLHAGWFQVSASRILRAVDPPVRVGILGSPRTRVDEEYNEHVSLFPEQLTVVTKRRRNCWVKEIAHRTLDRIEVFEAGRTEEAVAAREYYGDDVEPYRKAAVSALEEFETLGPSLSTESSDTQGDVPADSREDLIADERWVDSRADNRDRDE